MSTIATTTQLVPAPELIEGMFVVIPADANHALDELGQVASAPDRIGSRQGDLFEFQVALRTVHGFRTVRFNEYSAPLEVVTLAPAKRVLDVAKASVLDLLSNQVVLSSSLFDTDGSTTATVVVVETSYVPSQGGDFPKPAHVRLHLIIPGVDGAMMWETTPEREVLVLL